MVWPPLPAAAPFHESVTFPSEIVVFTEHEVGAVGKIALRTEFDDTLQPE